MYTFASLARNPAAIISPIPREPPVTTATLPEMENSELRSMGFLSSGPRIVTVAVAHGQIESSRRASRDLRHQRDLPGSSSLQQIGQHLPGSLERPLGRTHRTQ